MFSFRKMTYFVSHCSRQRNLANISVSRHCPSLQTRVLKRTQLFISMTDIDQCHAVPKTEGCDHIMHWGDQLKKTAWGPGATTLCASATPTMWCQLEIYRSTRVLFCHRRPEKTICLMYRDHSHTHTHTHWPWMD